MLNNVLKNKKISVVQFSKEIGKSRQGAYRVLSGERFEKIRELFQHIYRLTGMTPNEILDIPPKRDEENGDI